MIQRALFGLGLPCALALPMCKSVATDTMADAEQGLYNGVGGATGVPAVNNSKTGVGMLDMAGRKCVGTLVHNRFVVTVGNYCLGFPVAAIDHTITFKDANGNSSSPYGFDLAWMQKAVTYPATGADGAVLQSDLAILHTTSEVAAAYAPATIASTLPSSGAAVSSYGFGDFGASSCSSVADGKKRGINWSWGAPPYRVCSGDWGAPVFDSAMPLGEVVATVMHPNALGNLTRYREVIYEQMRYLLSVLAGPDGNPDIVPATSRAGTVLSSLTGISSAKGCQTECLKNDACKAFNYTAGTSYCILLSYAGRWVPATGTSSGLRPLRDVGFRRSGTLLSTGTQASAADCAAHCATNASCRSWSHNNKDENASALCTLNTDVGTRQAAPTVTSGIKLARPTGISLSGGTYATITNVASDGACSNSCASDARCLAFTYYTSTKRCELKDVIPVPVATAQAVSDFKRGYAAPTSALAGTRIGYGYTPDPAVPEKCQADCEANSDCAAYQTTGPSYATPMVCQLYSHVETQTSGGDARAGYKGLLWQ
jgi:hypothetical protein